MATKYHGTLIEYRDDFGADERKAFMERLPRRSEFVNAAEHETLIQDLKGGKPFLFLPNDVIDNHHKEETKLEYKPILIGVLRDGSKAALVLTGIDVSFELQVPDDADTWSFIASVKELLRDSQVYPRDVEITQHLPGKIFHEAPVEYLKISFNTLFQRKKAITALKYDENATTAVALSYKRKAKFGGVGFLNKPGGPYAQMAKDDMSCYYRKFARENGIKLANWNWIRSYKIVRDDNKYVRRTCVPYCFEVNIKDVYDLESLAKKDTLEGRAQLGVPVADPSKDAPYKDLLRDKSMVCGWDLETTSRRSNGNAPDPLKVFGPDGVEEDTIFLDSMAFRWHWSKDPLIRIAVSAIPTPPVPNCLIIQCGNQSELLKIKAIIMERMCPEINTGFNDGMYDWPFVLRRAEKYTCIIGGKKYPITEFMKMHMSVTPYDPAAEDAKYRVRGEYKEKLKLEPGVDYEPTVFMYPGTIQIDIRGLLMKLYPRAEKTSLNYFLSLNKLKSKEDMPYLVMFKAVRLLRLLQAKTKSDKFDDLMQYLVDLRALQTAGTLPQNHKLCTFADQSSVDSIDQSNQLIMNLEDSSYGLERITVDEAIKLIGGPAHGGKISEGAGMIINYCNEDADKCPELMLVRNIVPDKRAMANLSFTSMFDSLYRADGIKVCNLVMQYAADPNWNLAFSNVGSGKKDGRKYPGAYVVAPKKGLYRDHKIIKRKRRQAINKHDSLAFRADISARTDPSVSEESVRIDFRSRVDPMSPNFDKDLLDDVKHAAITQFASDTSKISLDESDDTDRPCTGLDFSSLYPSIIMAYNLSPEKVVLDRDEMTRLSKAGYDFIEVNFKYGLKDQPEATKEDILAWVVQHRHPARAIIMEEISRAKQEYSRHSSPTNGESNEHAWYKFVKRDVVDRVSKMFKETTLEQWKTYGMGIYPYILKELFDRRSKVKKLMEHYAEPREFLDKVFKELPLGEFKKLPLDEQKKKLVTMIDQELEARKAEYKKTGKGFHKFRITMMESSKEFFQKTWLDPEGEFGRVGIDELFAEMVFKIGYYNTSQLVLKVFMNTFYGIAGFSLSPLFLVAVAGGVTLYGRKNLKMVKGFVEAEDFGVLYGDSVTPDTPLLLRDPITKKMFYRTIDTLVDRYETYGEKESMIPPDNIEVWSDAGWTRIARVIRHKTDKKIYRVLTGGSCVDVTEDHSLLLHDGTVIKPKDLKIGDRLLEKALPDPEVRIDMKLSEAFVWGFFYAEGSCGAYKYDLPNGTSYIKYSWAVNGQELDYLTEVQEALKIAEPGLDFKILDTMESSSVYKLVPFLRDRAADRGRIRDLVVKYRELMYDKDKHKKVPDEIINTNGCVMAAFMRGYYMGDGDKDSRQKTYRFDNKGKIGSAGLYFINAALVNDISINTREDKPDIFRLTVSDKRRKPSSLVKRIEWMGANDGYVYDLETENHHFSAGIGKLIVHNTDSLYTTCPKSKFAVVDQDYVTGKITKKDYWTRLIEITMETMDEFKKEVNSYLMLMSMSPFLTMAYEEALWPYCKFGKKKYIGVQHQNIVNLGVCMPGVTVEEFMTSKSLMIRGLEIVKRGSSDFLKRVCYDIFRQAFNIDETRTLKEIIEDKLQEITKTRWDPNVFSKSAKYKLPGINPETGERKQGNISVLRFVDRMAALERTNPEFGIKPPEVGERFKYVIVKKYPWKYDTRGNQVDISMSDKYEFLESLDNKLYRDSVGGLEIDLDYYVTGEAIGQFARFVIYHPDYDQFSAVGITISGGVHEITDEEYEVADKAAWSYAKKTLTQFYETTYGTKYAKKGKVHKAVFKGVNQRVLRKLDTVYGAAGQLFTVSNTIATRAAGSDDVETDLADMGTVNDVANRLVIEAKKLGTKWATPLALGPLVRGGKGGSELHKWVRSLEMDPYRMQVCCVTGPGSYYRTQRERLDVIEKRLTHSIRLLIPKFQAVYADNIQLMINWVDKVVSANNLDKMGNESRSNDDETQELLMAPSFDALDAVLGSDSGEVDDPEYGEFLDVATQKAQNAVFELYDTWVELISIYKQLVELDCFRDNLKDMRALAVDKTAVPIGLRPQKGRSTKDDFLEWLNTKPTSIDTTL